MSGYDIVMLSEVRRAEAYAVMLRRKAEGTWTGPDIPERLGGVAAPVGYRTLQEAALRWLQHQESLGVALDDDSDLPVRAIVESLIQGDPQSYAVNAAGVVSRIPGTVWMDLIEQPHGWQNAGTSIAYDCLAGPAFEPGLVGLVPLIKEADYQRIGQSPVTQDGDDDPPWTRARLKITRWLESDHSDDWANERLRKAGARVDEQGRRDEFAHALNHYRANFTLKSIETVRNRAGKKIRG